MTPIDRARIERALALPGARRSDYDLNPAWKEKLASGRTLRPAAVLCGLIERDNGLHVILTRRPDFMREHAGQVAFPGGKIEPGDRTPEHAALREANEEIGLPAELAEIIGRSDPYETGTGFRVQPVVAMIDPRFAAVPDPSEVAEIFETPLDYLMDRENLEVHDWIRDGLARRYYAYNWQGRFIWGATAGMLKSLADRVAEA